MATKKGEKNAISPMMAHRNELKEKYPDTILLYRLGDFYEMFFEDAIKASRILDLTLTGRDCGLEERAPMCGVPYHAVDSYIARLVAAGEKVAICEQLTAPGDQKGLLQRDVIRVITPGTNTIEDMLDGSVNHYLVAVAKFKNDYAVSALDIVTGEFIVKYFPDTTLSGCEDYLLGCAPSEIIAPMDICVESRSLLSVSTERLVKFTTYYDYSFDYDNGKSALLKQYSVFGLEALGLEDNKAVIGALGGLLDYVKSTQKRFLSHLSVPKLISSADEMYIDYNTRRNLELTETLSDGKKNGSLLWVLDRTKTGMGARMLHQWVLHPLHSVSEIEKRQSGVAELAKGSLTRSALGQALEPVRDLERLVTKISYGSIMPRDCNNLKDSLKQLPIIKKVLDKLHAEYFTELSADYYDFSELVALLERTIAPVNLPATLKDGGYIAVGCNAELDRLRSLGADSAKLISDFQERQRELTGVPSLKVGNNRVFGYYIEITNAKRPEVLPSDYVRRQTIANGERYVNSELLNLEREIFSATENALQLESEIYAELVKTLNEYVSRLKSIAAFIAKADCIYSLSLVAAENKYVRPKVTQGGMLNIIDGRHPVVEKLLKRNEFVPNDTALDKNNPVAILTGPNMAGKSTYIRQVALITLMAHIGSFVPATKAEIGLCDRIFTRVGASDNLIRGQSTFMVEMLEVANILNN
ncbi:MAG: DNA mismatch repair protein MutS, partial [Clostridia bacterium]|nr:DNA mismatch repair protein MutS [Clostridia bacterium]